MNSEKDEAMETALEATMSKHPWGLTTEASFAAGYHARDAEVAELQKQVARESERGVEYLEGLLRANPRATLASTLDLIRATRPPKPWPSV